MEEDLHPQGHSKSHTGHKGKEKSNKDNILLDSNTEVKRSPTTQLEGQMERKRKLLKKTSKSKKERKSSHKKHKRIRED